MSILVGNPFLLNAAETGYQVSRSLRFNSADSAYLSRTPASAGNRKTFTWSAWVKRAKLGAGGYIFSCDPNSSNYSVLYWDTSTVIDALSFQEVSGGSQIAFRRSAAVFRDPSAWYHIVFVVDTTQATASNRIKMYVNGSQITDFNSQADPSQNADFSINSANQHNIGRMANFAVPFDGYLADIWFLDGIAATPSDFAETDATTGQWIPKTYSGSKGSNGFHLEFADNSAATAAALGKDTSGNGNNWTPNNFSVFNGNGTYSTGTITAGSSDGSISQAFNGVLVRTVNAAGITTASGNLLTYTLPSTINYSSKVEIAAYNNSAGTGYAGLGTGDPTGGTSVPNVSTGNSVPWTTLATGSGSFTAVSVRNSAERVGWVGLRIDGVTVLVDYSAGAGNDSLVDTPTSYGTDAQNGGEVRGNYCTLNPLSVSTSGTVTLANGNLDWQVVNGNGGIRGTVAVSTGKWYFEFTYNQKPSGGGTAFGVLNVNDALGFIGGTSGGYSYYSEGASYTKKVNNNIQADYGASFAPGDVIGVALDLDAGTITFYKNGASQGQAFSGLSGTFAPACASGTGTGTAQATLNAGQRAFAYTAPSGFKALCDTNLPTPVVAKPSTVMDVKLYTGNGGSQSISSVGFSPDLVWIKQRSGSATAHSLEDIVRGTSKHLASNATDAEVDVSVYGGGVTAFNSAGFSVGSWGAVNENNQTYVSWLWDAGTTTSSNGSGSITSSVRANATSGFSIATWTLGSSNVTVGHGLGVTPSLIICKARSDTSQWIVYHTSTGIGGYLYLSATNAVGTNIANVWSPVSSTVFGVNTGLFPANRDYVSYHFAPVSGYSSAFSYTGNGSSDGPMVYLGFRPRFILQKRTDAAGSWLLLDTSRDPYNAAKNELFANSSIAEYTNTDEVDFLSNGFKVRCTFANLNASGGTFIGYAFAENPFQYARAR